MGVNQLAAAGFVFINRNDVVRCTFCEAEVAQWVEGDDAFKEHQRWSTSCAFVKMLFVGNIPAPPKTSQQQPSSSNDVCGSYMEYTLKHRVQNVSIHLRLFIYVILCMIITAC
jgi:hypothetical protein